MPYKDKDAQRAYQAAWVKQQRQEFFKDKSCVTCGSVSALELDHVDRLKKVSHRIWSWSREKRIAELQKCQVLCRACHRAKTEDERGYRQHSARQYEANGCRCAVCTEDHRAKMAAWRARRRKL